MKSTLRALADIITQCVDTIESICATRGVEFPDLDDPVRPGSEEICQDPEVAKAASMICAATQQLGLVVRPPFSSILMQSTGVGSCLCCVRLIA